MLENFPACKDLLQGGVRFLSPKIGVCYTFNFGPLYKASGHELSTYTADSYYGLSLDIDIESERWLKI